VDTWERSPGQISTGSDGSSGGTALALAITTPAMCHLTQMPALFEAKSNPIEGRKSTSGGAVRGRLAAGGLMSLALRDGVSRLETTAQITLGLLALAKS
jgi:hypothetical protein